MKLHGRKFNRPPPLVAKSGGTDCGPKRVVSARFRFAIDKGVANVHATMRRMSADSMARPAVQTSGAKRNAKGMERRLVCQVEWPFRM